MAARADDVGKKVHERSTITVHTLDLAFSGDLTTGTPLHSSSPPPPPPPPPLVEVAPLQERGVVGLARAGSPPRFFRPGSFGAGLELDDLRWRTVQSSFRARAAAAAA